ncbi:hypothetical protein HMF7854_03455 [Sphingomonas ginkgonis]|uniref:Uncharacterized protein n=1 Tax=Sphingomonas ginkgonis TaxID=2315330 RepID=A0A429V7Z8_9SPHN|nr:hypothetical protein [Sphingomonas ginkgonis]RST29987.1 hypothetical protein HMF7854_03455 [Sphingomonas ginkgonis]
MATPLGTGKKTVDLATNGPRRRVQIRRDPPPVPAKPPSAQDIRERETRELVVGVVVFAVALVALFILVERALGWTQSPPATIVLVL